MIAQISHNIQNSPLCKQNRFNKAISFSACILTIAAVCIFIISLITIKNHPFNVIAQLGNRNIATFLSTSLLLLVLEVAWICLLFRPPSFELIDKKSPRTISSLILTFLDPESLAKCCCVNKKWSLYANQPRLWNAFDLQKVASKKLTIIDETYWQNKRDLLNIDLRDITPPDKRTIISVIKLIPPIGNNAGVTLLTIPKGLSFGKLLTLLSTLRGQGTIVRNTREAADFNRQFGNVKTIDTYRIVITNHVIEGSTCSYSDNIQQVAFNRRIYGHEIEYEFPKILEMCTLIIATFEQSGIRLFNEEVSSRCREVDGNEVAIGGDNFALINFYPVRDYVSNIGAAARKKLNCRATHLYQRADQLLRETNQILSLLGIPNT